MRGARRTLSSPIAGGLVVWPIAWHKAPRRSEFQKILEMIAGEVAATSPFTKRAYDAQLAHADRIQKKLRDTVLYFLSSAPLRLLTEITGPADAASETVT